MGCRMSCSCLQWLIGIMSSSREDLGRIQVSTLAPSPRMSLIHAGHWPWSRQVLAMALDDTRRHTQRTALAMPLCMETSMHPCQAQELAHGIPMYNLTSAREQWKGEEGWRDRRSESVKIRAILSFVSVLLSFTFPVYWCRRAMTRNALRLFTTNRIIPMLPSS